MGVEIACVNRLFLSGIANGDLAKSAVQVVEVLGEAENRHDLGGRDDIKPIFPWKAVADASERPGDLAQRAIVHVQPAPPADPTRVNVELVVPMDMIVDHRCE